MDHFIPRLDSVNAYRDSSSEETAVTTGLRFPRPVAASFLTPLHIDQSMLVGVKKKEKSACTYISSSVIVSLEIAFLRPFFFGGGMANGQKKAGLRVESELTPVF